MNDFPGTRSQAGSCAESVHGKTVRDAGARLLGAASVFVAVFTGAPAGEIPCNICVEDIGRFVSNN